MVKTIPIHQNPTYSRLLSSIGNEITSTELAEKVKKEQSPIQRQLKYLEEHKYVILSKERKQFNRKLYSINWKKIMSDFTIYLENISKLYYREYSQLRIIGYNDIKKEILDDREIFRNVLKNKYILELLKITFIDQTKYYYENATLENVFDRLISIIIYQIDYTKNKSKDSFKKYFVNKIDSKILELFTLLGKLSLIKDNSVIDKYVKGFK